MNLYQTINQKQLAQIVIAEYRKFSLQEPCNMGLHFMLSLPFAEQMARKSLKHNPRYAVFISEVQIEDDFIKQYQITNCYSIQEHREGTKKPWNRILFQELTIPSGHLKELNNHLVGSIKKVASYYGHKYIGEIDKKTNLPISVITNK